MDLSYRRPYASMGAPMPIPYSEFDAWVRYTGNEPLSLERRAIEALDQCFIESHARK